MIHYSRALLQLLSSSALAFLASGAFHATSSLPSWHTCTSPMGMMVVIERTRRPPLSLSNVVQVPLPSSQRCGRQGIVIFQQRQEQQQQQNEENNSDGGKNKNNQQASKDNVDIVNTETNENTPSNNSGTNGAIDNNDGSTGDALAEARSDGDKDTVTTSDSVTNSFSSIMDKIQQNICNPVPLLSPSRSTSSSSSGVLLGKRGELTIFIELVLLYSILRGYVPIFNHLMQFFFGPILFAAGIIITILGCRELNTFQSFTPLTKPIPMAKGGDFVTSNIYSYIRHPVYAGNIYCFIGLSIITESSTRLFLSLVYYFLVDMKSNVEEQNMESIYGANVYQLYKNRVKGKFVPSINRLFPKKEVDQIGIGSGSNMTVSSDGDDDNNPDGFDTQGSRGFLFP